MYEKNEKEQKIHIRMLATVKHILDKYKIKSILSGAALLGIVRDKKPIPWCEGFALVVDYNDVKPYEEEIKKELKRHGFEIRKHFKNKSRWKIRAHKGILNIEIVGYFKDGKYYVRRKSTNKRIIPIHFIKETGRFRMPDGTVYNCPRDIEGFLTHVYGSWKIPIKSKTPSVYHAKTFVRKI